MRSTRIANAKARRYVQGTRPFKGSNLYGEWVGTAAGKRFVAYSYGPHWPLFIYDEHTTQWFENRDKYSATTSRHRSQTHPHCYTTLLSVEAMRCLANQGYPTLIASRLAGELA